MKGTFITFEGPEGAGKTTILHKVEEYYINKGIDVIKTREPGGIHIAEQIRSIILNPNHLEMDGRTEALLYAASRRQHLVEKVIPALNQGKIVLCDRFIDSSLAYQGYARGLGIDEVFSINKFAIENCMPDVTLYFDISPEIGMKRIEANKDREVNRLDLEKMDFHYKVNEAYKILVKRFPERIKVINAEHEVDKVFTYVLTELQKHI